MGIVAFAALSFPACATKPEPQLVDSEKRESSLPWNKQEKWEGAGALGPMAGGFGGEGRP